MDPAFKAARRDVDVSTRASIGGDGAGLKRLLEQLLRGTTNPARSAADICGVSALPGKFTPPDLRDETITRLTRSMAYLRYRAERAERRLRYAERMISALSHALDERTQGPEVIALRPGSREW